MVERTKEDEANEYKSSRRCTQKQCIYNTFGGCQACAECGEAPHMIKCDCSVCLACENIPDMLRWDNGTKEVNPAIKEKNEKEVEKKKKLVILNE